MRNHVIKGSIPRIMTRSRRTQSFIPPHKRSRDVSELKTLAEVLRLDWRPGDRVMTWFHRHEGRHAELSALVRDGWSWADIGQAMHLAGITFGTGKPIPGDTIRGKAWKARRAEQMRRESAIEPQPLVATHAPLQAPAIQPANPTPVEPLTRPSTLMVPDAEPHDDEPEFRPVTLRNWSGLKPVQAPAPIPPKAEAKGRSAAEVSDLIAQLAGKK